MWQNKNSIYPKNYLSANQINKNKCDALNEFGNETSDINKHTRSSLSRHVGESLKTAETSFDETRRNQSVKLSIPWSHFVKSCHATLLLFTKNHRHTNRLTDTQCRCSEVLSVKPPATAYLSPQPPFSLKPSSVTKIPQSFDQENPPNVTNFKMATKPCREEPNPTRVIWT